MSTTDEENQALRTMLAILVLARGGSVRIPIATMQTLITDGFRLHWEVDPIGKTGQLTVTRELPVIEGEVGCSTKALSSLSEETTSGDDGTCLAA